MAKKQIKNYVFEPGISKDDNAFPNAYALLAANKAFILLHKWDIWFILSFRFIYGIRMISPVIIGSSGISPARFIPLNLAAAIVWTAISCAGGYLLGSVIESIDFKLIEKYIALFSVLLLISLGGLGYYAWKKLSSSPPEDEE